jgi:hypothetical protein
VESVEDNLRALEIYDVLRMPQMDRLPKLVTLKIWDATLLEIHCHLHSLGEAWAIPYLWCRHRASPWPNPNNLKSLYHPTPIRQEAVVVWKLLSMDHVGIPLQEEYRSYRCHYHLLPRCLLGAMGLVFLRWWEDARYAHSYSD